jgi:hypothetical protein
MKAPVAIKIPRMKSVVGLIALSEALQACSPPEASPPSNTIHWESETPNPHQTKYPTTSLHPR